jgi:hypothetical protein
MNLVDITKEFWRNSGFKCTVTYILVRSVAVG